MPLHKRTLFSRVIDLKSGRRGVLIGGGKVKATIRLDDGKITNLLWENVGKVAEFRLSKKRCGECGEVKLKNEFHKSATNRDGLAWQCKECCQKYKAAWKAMTEKVEREAEIESEQALSCAGC